MSKVSTKLVKFKIGIIVDVTLFGVRVRVLSYILQTGNFRDNTGVV